MSSEPFRPYTSRVDPQLAGLPDTYISERPVAAEYLPPDRGAPVGNAFGPAYADHIVIGSQIVNRPGGRTVQITHCAPPTWVVLNGSEKNRALNASVGFTQQVVRAPTASEVIADPLSSYSPINEVMAVKRTELVPTAALTAFYQSFPSTVNLDIPRVLTSASVIWHQDQSEGNFESDFNGVATGESRSLSGNESANSQASASVVPELQLSFQDIQGSNIPSVTHTFFMEMPVTLEGLMAVLAGKIGGSVTVWPIFKPRSDTIILRGRKVAVSARASGDAGYSTQDAGATFSQHLSKGKGDSFDISPSIEAVTIPPCIHGSITIANNTSPIMTARATAAVEWVGSGGVPSMTNNSVDAVLTASGSVAPTSLAATSPSSIPSSGIKLVRYSAESFDWGYAIISAETVDASIFA